MSDRAMILEDLKPLYKKARAEGLWFYCRYQQLWFSPDRLQKEHEDDRFIWGAGNWRLRDPNERREQLKGVITNAQKRLEDFEKLLGEGL